jgi:flagellar basal body-associated protein FliL
MKNLVKRILAACLLVMFMMTTSLHAEEIKNQPISPQFVELGDFTVNVGKHTYLVLTLNLEILPDHKNAVEALMSRIKDAVVFKLFGLRDSGALKAESIEPTVIKDAIFDAISKVVPDAVKEVLVTRLLTS